MYFILNYYVISIFKFYAMFKILNSINSNCCVNLILHVIKFKIVKSDREANMMLTWLWADDRSVGGRVGSPELTWQG
jgi:hypothetical protein